MQIKKASGQNHDGTVHSALNEEYKSPSSFKNTFVQRPDSTNFNQGFSQGYNQGLAQGMNQGAFVGYQQATVDQENAKAKDKVSATSVIGTIALLIIAGIAVFFIATFVLQTVGNNKTVEDTIYGLGWGASETQLDTYAEKNNMSLLYEYTDADGWLNRLYSLSDSYKSTLGLTDCDVVYVAFLYDSKYYSCSYIVYNAGLTDDTISTVCENVVNAYSKQWKILPTSSTSYSAYWENADGYAMAGYYTYFVDNSKDLASYIPNYDSGAFIMLKVATPNTSTNSIKDAYDSINTTYLNNISNRTQNTETQLNADGFDFRAVEDIVTEPEDEPDTFTPEWLMKELVASWSSTVGFSYLNYSIDYDNKLLYLYIGDSQDIDAYITQGLEMDTDSWTSFRQAYFDSCASVVFKGFDSLFAEFLANESIGDNMSWLNDYTVAIAFVSDDDSHETYLIYENDECVFDYVASQSANQ